MKSRADYQLFKERYKMLLLGTLRSCITNWAKRLPIQTVQFLAGHSNIATTRKYYLSVQSSDMETARDIQSKVMTSLTNF